MARAYSHDLRTRVLDAVGAGLSRRAAAARYRIGIATVIRWAAHAAATGQTGPQRQGRPPGSKLDPHEAFLLALIEEKVDITLSEMQARLRHEHGVAAGLGTLWRFFARRAVTWKKSRRTPPSRIAPTWQRPARRGSRRSRTSIQPA
jgi:transposase